MKASRKILRTLFDAKWTELGYPEHHHTKEKAWTMFLFGRELYKQSAIREDDLRPQFYYTVDDMIEMGGGFDG